MFRKAPLLIISMLLVLILNGLTACTSFSSGSISQTKKPVSTPTVTPTVSLDKFVPMPDWHSVGQQSGTNPANTDTQITLSTLAAQPSVVIHVQCQGTGTVKVLFQIDTNSQYYAILPPSCKTGVPSELNYSRKTFPKTEKDSVMVSIHGNVKWQAMVEVPNS